MPPREADKTAVKLKKKEDKAKRKIEKTPLSANAANHEIELEEIVLDNSVTEAENPEEHSPNSNGLSQVPRSNDSLSEDTPPADPQALYGVTPNAFWVATSASMLAITYLLIIALAGIVLWQFIVHEYEQHVIAWVIGAIFVMASVPLALQDIHFHIIHYVSPLQRHYVRILWMIPIYAVESWLALRFNEQKIYLETMREAYESYVVYSFFKLMREFLGDKPRAVARLKKVAEEKGRGKAIMLWPCCCMTAWRLDAQFLTRCSLGVWQYVFIRTISAVLACILEHFHLYGEGTYDLNKFYVYYLILVNTSQCWALYCLILFYKELSGELAAIGPLPKFLVVKAVVFVSWWQGILIMFAASNHMLNPVLDYSAEDVAKGLQNLLICAEMFIYGLLFHVIFSYRDFKQGGKLSEYLKETQAHKLPASYAVKQMLPTDVIVEGKQYAQKAKRLVKNKISDMPNLPEVPLRLIRPSKSDENLPSQILMDLEKAQQEGKLARDDMDEIQEGGEEVDKAPVFRPPRRAASDSDIQLDKVKPLVPIR
uniref:Uncharacterized protein n=1 Tax=Hanusia phi TaxID=3032 RepID=A0A7S0EV46_9CRYP|mmetsp:Transcript_31599/g.71078  ORF Transcript_31599/g.71078 Transcript_31599/m.71078 type:complete len:540 (+) Transcript_31599:240-1859(+)